jgi:hypothetical protein
MWARGIRWSAAFPVIESYDIENPPNASDVFGTASYRRLFAHPERLLRPLNDEERSKISDLVLIPRPTASAWIAIADEVAFAMRDEQKIPQNIRRNIDSDLPVPAWKD